MTWCFAFVLLCFHKDYEEIVASLMFQAFRSPCHEPGVLPHVFAFSEYLVRVFVVIGLG